MAMISESKFGRWSSLRLRPRSAKPSMQTIPCSTSCIPLRMVPRFQPNSRSANRWPPSPKACTVRAMNIRRALPLSSLAVFNTSTLTSSVSSIIVLQKYFPWKSISSLGQLSFPKSLTPETLLTIPTTSQVRQSAQEDTSRSRVSQRGMNMARLTPMPRPKVPSEPGKLPAFRAGVPALALFPYQVWAQMVTRRVRHSLQQASDDQDPAGYRPLREAIAAHIGVTRGVRCTADQVIVVSGAQAGLDLAARILLDPGDMAWIEEPGYPGARGA